MKKGLVSIITPCYNGEKYVHRLLDSILIQDYPLIEMFIIDDGSTDNTKNKIEAYISKFQNKGYTLSYVYQENAGQASALNRGLKLIKGEYLIWPDADDFFSSKQSISIFVSTLFNLDKSYGLARCYERLIDDNNNAIFIRKFQSNSGKLFYGFLDGTESQAAAGAYMVKLTAFDEVNPSRSIYDKYYPQNIQMVLPVLYKYKCYSINEPLINILVHADSHSREKHSYGELIHIHNELYEINKETLLRMDLPDEILTQAMNICKNKCVLKKFELACLYKKKNDIKKYYKKLCSLKMQINRNIHFKYLISLISPTLLKKIIIIKNSFKHV